MWYYELNDTTVGPVSDEVVQQLIHAGVVKGATLVCQVGQSDWQPLTETSLGKSLHTPRPSKPQPPKIIKKVSVAQSADSPPAELRQDQIPPELQVSALPKSKVDQKGNAPKVANDAEGGDVPKTPPPIPPLSQQSSTPKNRWRLFETTGQLRPVAALLALIALILVIEVLKPARPSDQAKVDGNTLAKAGEDRIEAVLQQDMGRGLDRSGISSFTELAEKLGGVDTEGCPGDFRAAQLRLVHSFEEFAAVEQQVYALQGQADNQFSGVLVAATMAKAQNAMRQM